MNQLLKLLLFVIFTLVIAGGSQSAKAENAIINCHGCSLVQQSNAARKAVSSGLVWVFNGPANSVSKFDILDEKTSGQGVLQLTPELTVEPALNSKFQKYLSAVNTAAQASKIALPPGYAVSSVSLLASPSNGQWAAQTISQHINTLPWAAQWSREYKALVEQIRTTTGVSGTGVSAGNSPIVFTVYFQDLSFAYFDLNAEDHGSNALLKAAFTRDAFDAKGNPVPTGIFGWDGVAWVESSSANAAWQSYGSELKLDFVLNGGGENCAAFMMCNGDPQNSVVTCSSSCP